MQFMSYPGGVELFAVFADISYPPPPSGVAFGFNEDLLYLEPHR